MVTRFLAGCGAGMMLFLAAPAAHASTAAEYDVKAAFLYNFAKFVEWPSETFKNSGGSFVIGILGEDPFEKTVKESLSGLAVQDKKLVFLKLTDLEHAGACHEVYISASEQDRLDAILETLRGTPVLTVSDMKKFVQRGGMVGFVIDKNKVRFDINRTVAENAGLKISSQLLKLAKIIVKKLTAIPIG